MKFKCVFLVAIAACFTIMSRGYADNLDYDAEFKRLEQSVPPIIGERGRLVNCDGVMMPAVRLNTWAKYLTPKDDENIAIVKKYAQSKFAATRYIAIRALAYAKNIQSFDLGDNVSFYDALQNKKSEAFKQLERIVIRKNPRANQ